MKTTMRERIEELQARSKNKHWKTGRPQWLQTPRMRHHIHEAEMVSLSRDCDFARIPAELQLDVISFLDYESVLRLKKTCRYFNYFINADVIKESKNAQIERYKHMEQRSTVPTGTLPCYTCLKLQPMTEFWSKTGGYYQRNTTTSYYRPGGVRPLGLDVNRHCIRCGFKDGKFEPGQRLTVGHQSWMVCAGCGILTKEPNSSYFSAYDTTCKPCANEYKFLQSNGHGMRMLQWIIAIIILPLTCKGKSMPWTSRADEHSLRWIFTITLDLLTIGGTFASIVARAQNLPNRYSFKRSGNNQFVFLTEGTATILWAAILVALFNEGHQRHFTGRFDRFAKALTAMVFLELLLFVITTLWSIRRTRERLAGTKRPELV